MSGQFVWSCHTIYNSPPFNPFMQLSHSHMIFYFFMAILSLSMLQLNGFFLLFGFQFPLHTSSYFQNPTARSFLPGNYPPSHLIKSEFRLSDILQQVQLCRIFWETYSLTNHSLNIQNILWMARVSVRNINIQRSLLFKHCHNELW